MKGLIQRVKRASVKVEGQCVGEISTGLLLFLGLERGDDELASKKLLEKVLAYRVFPDVQGKMNLSLRDVSGELLIVSQFTIVANTRKGLRPSFSEGAAPEQGEYLYEHFVNLAAASGLKVATGEFGADMAVELINDGPVTFMLEV